ncbi:hypothetical protein PPGU16_84240 (plasmid) [Paraburkholderia largidicola]|uniref:Uncharacterized protein n=2 Tax=Paraburkholderia largidicola TaxID=3014751 RepID=A0A7I8C2Q9_9BURK|nr:hypothetical protein PPGU16_84240 [Paraburkholderia sp. PGU16]
MYGLVQGNNSQECQDAIHSYFDVVSYRHGHPDLNQTAKDRLSLTRQCKSTSDEFTSMIDRTFGSVIK